MEDGLGDPLSVAKDATLIKEAQSEIGKLDILICGICHGVFHFVEEFNTHKTSKCLESSVPKICENDDKAQAWAFCLWKNKEMKSLSGDKNSAMWSIYQKWCKLPQETRDSWIAGGETLLSLNKIRIAKMQEVKFKVKREEEKDPLALTDNDMQGLDDKVPDKNNANKHSATKSTKPNEPVAKTKKDTDKDKDEPNEYVVESILGKRFNAKKKHWEYKVKWENWDESQCSWEPIEHLTGCKSLIQKFEVKLRLEKEKKKAPESPKSKPKSESKTDDESTDHGSSTRRPQRSSKQKALNQVKRWLGEGSDNEETNKRSHEDDDSDQSFEKRMKLEEESDESYEDDEEERPKKTPMMKPRSGVSNGLSGKKIPHNVLIPDAQGIVRINQKQLPSLSSGVYIMSKTAGIIKLDSQASKIAACGGKAVVKVAPRIGQTHIRIVKKDGGTSNRVIQMSPAKSKTTPLGMSRTPLGHKLMRQTPSGHRIIKIEPKSDEQKKMAKEKEDSKDAQSAADEDSDSGIPELEFPAEIVPPDPEEPPADFTLDPTTGKIAGVEYPDPEPEQELSTEENKENAENTLDNIVKLAAADITEADLKPDLTEPMVTDNISEDSEMNVEEARRSLIEEKKQTPESIHREELIKIRKEHVPASRVQHKFVITPSAKSSNILERTLQSPRTVVKSPQGYARQVYAAKSPQRILNSSMTPKLTSPMNPMVRTVVRSSKPKPVFPKQRIYMSSPSSKFNESIIKPSYPKSSLTKRVGNIGGTTIYRRSPQQAHRMSSSPKLIQRTNVVRKSTATVVRTVVQKTPKPVISMPSLIDDDLPMQSMPESMQIIPKVEAGEMPEAAVGAAVPGVTTETDLSSFTLNDGEAPIFITGDDGTVYQVAGQNEQGQTILITQGPDGQQQCLLVTSENATPDENSQEENPNQVATVGIENAAEMPVQQSEGMDEMAAAEETHQDPQEPLTIKTEADTSDQVVAQVVRAEPPSPGGTHKVVVMLPDGNLMVTQVTPEEYASLELDK